MTQHIAESHVRSIPCTSHTDLNEILSYTTTDITYPIFLYSLVRVLFCTVLVGNTRKAMTIVLSFVLFPKPYNWMYVAGGVLVFGSLIGKELMKEKLSKQSGGGGKKDGALLSGV